MKKTILVLIGLLAGPVAGAQVDLKEAFQREHGYLVSQREVLARQQREQETRHRRELQALMGEVMRSEKALVAATSANDELFAEIQELEKKLREQNTREGSLAATLKKARKVLLEGEAGLKFEAVAKAEIPTDSATPEDFVRVHRDALDLLRRSSSIERARLAVRDQEGQLKEREILRIGRVGAQSTGPLVRQVLGPAGDGSLQELGIKVEAAASGLTPVYLFDRLLEKAVIKRPATWVDRAANAAPVVLLGALFAMVGGLFWALARE